MNDNNQAPLPPRPPMDMGGDTSVMSTKDWVITYLIMIIPCVGLIMSFVWAFSGSGNLNRRNYCRAYLIIVAVMIVLAIILNIVLAGAMFALMDAMMMW